MRITFEEIKNNETIRTYIKKADESLRSLGYTEHSFAHVTKVGVVARDILLKLGYGEREAELAAIAGFMHDIGNVINRKDHAQSGAVMAFRILDNMHCDPEDTATIITAIGNHDESTAFPVNPVAAALIIADKCDVRSSRVRDKATIALDIHDRVNYGVTKSDVSVDAEAMVITLRIEIDTNICSVMEYFEIFIERMLLCKKAAEKLDTKFQLVINNQQIL